MDSQPSAPSFKVILIGDSSIYGLFRYRKDIADS